ncbi:hypothetical protein ACP4OV_022060 [Aristida adscensionis]
MEEEWRQLARMVPGTLMGICFDATVQLARTVQAAQNKLAVDILLERMLVTGVPLPAAPPDLHPVGRRPGEVLEAARQSLRRLMEFHAAAGYLFDLYAAHRGGLPEAGDPLWQLWEGHRAEVLNRAAVAAERLRAAAAHAKAADDALGMFGDSPPGTTAWAAASLEHNRQAFWEATTAVVTVSNLCSAVEMEFADAWAIILSHG